MKHALSAFMVAWIAGALATPAPADMLLSNDSIPDGTGWAVGTAVEWIQFQPFTVPEPGWHVTSIGVDGWLGFLPEAGTRADWLLGTLLGDDGTGSPDEDNPLADGTYYLPQTNGMESNWRYDAFDVGLSPGRYWMRWSSDDNPNYFPNLFGAVSGEEAYVMRTNPPAGPFHHEPTALRILGTVVPGSPIPTVSEWGLIVMALVLLTSGAIVLRRGGSKGSRIVD